MNEYLQKIVYLTQADYNTLATGTTANPVSITKNGKTLTNLNNNYIYMTTGDITNTDLGSTVIDVAHGGTGNNSLYSGQVLVGSGTAAVSFIQKTNDNIANTLVQRDGDGSFNANHIIMTSAKIGSVTFSNSAATGITLIRADSTYMILGYKQSGDGVNTNQWCVGTSNLQGVIRTGPNQDLLHSRATVTSTIIDTGNYKTYTWALPATITADQVLVSSDAAGNTTLRAITNVTAVGNPTANTNLITANTLMNYKGTTNIATVGTVTSGTWNGSTIGIAYGGTGLSSTTAHYVFSGPASGTGAPSWKLLTADDLPAHTHSYLPLSGGSVTGGITFSSDSTGAWNSKGIIFTGGSRIGEHTSKALGIYSGEKLYLRPNSSTQNSGQGIEISATYLYPSITTTMSLGDSSHKWTNVYSTTFTGALSGNASSATEFASAASVTLTGDVTGTASAKKGWSVATTIANKAVTPAKMADTATITIGTQAIKVGGSFNSTTLVTDLGLSSAMHYRGAVTADPTTTTPTGTYVSGDVLSNSTNAKEFVYDGASWRELGSESSYKKVQDAVSDPTAGTTAVTDFIATISQDTEGKITPTKRPLPVAATNVAGITIVGASGGAAAYNHTHTAKIEADSGTNAITLATNTKYKLTAGGSSYIFTTQNDAIYLKNIGRLTNMNVDFGTTAYNSKFFISYADGSTTANKPYQNAMVLNVAWDNISNNHYGAQIALGNSTTPHLQTRGCANGTWDTSWITVLDDNNTTIPTTVPTLSWGATATILTINGSAVKIKAMDKPSYTYSDVGAAAESHTHSYAGSSTTGGAATNAVTTADTTNTLYPVGVKSSATSTLLHDTSITMKGGTINASALEIGASGKYVNFTSTGIKLGEATATANGPNLITVNGHMVINGSYNSSNSWSEGIRINRSSNGWANLVLGGRQGTTSGTEAGVWTIGPKSAPADATSTATSSKFYISYNGSDSATCRITGHGSDGWSIRPRLGVGLDVDTNYGLKVAGSSWLQGPLRIGNADTAGTGTGQNGYAVANSGSTNYIAFYGVNGDGAGNFNHTYIGESIYGPKDTVNERSELLLFKGNDVGTTTSGPDRIRLLANEVDIQVYESQLYGSWDTIRSTSGTQVANFAKEKVTINGKVAATQYAIEIDSAEMAHIEYNSTDKSLDFIFN